MTEKYVRFFEQGEESEAVLPKAESPEIQPLDDIKDKDFPKERMYQKTLASIYKYAYNGLLEDLLNYQEAALTFMEPAFIEVLEGSIENIKTAIEPLEEYTKNLASE